MRFTGYLGNQISLIAFVLLSLRVTKIFARIFFTTVAVVVEMQLAADCSHRYRRAAHPACSAPALARARA